MRSKNISISLIRLYAGVLLVLLVITFTGCIFFAGSDTGIAVPNLTVKGAPSHITALSLKVTGPGMAPVESYYSSVPSSISIEVPAGKDREFELFMYTQSATLRGVATSDLTAGKTTEIVLTMGLNETKLVIPDYKNNRIVQIDNISGSGWTTLVGSNIGWPLLNLAPYDVDFDSQGRIYIANYNIVPGYRRVIRVDDITGKNYFAFPDQIFEILALTVDRKNNYLYYASSTSLWRVNLDGTNDTLLDTTGIGLIRGMAVDENGILYIAGMPSAGGNAVFQYDPIAEIITLPYTTDLATPWDTLVKQNYLYIANEFGGPNLRIIRLNKEDLTSPIGYGVDVGTPDTSEGSFYNPRRFVAILNRKITIIDDQDFGNIDKLVSMDDIFGTNWTTLPTTGDGQSLFKFYSSC